MNLFLEMLRDEPNAAAGALMAATAAAGVLLRSLWHDESRLHEMRRERR